MSAPTNKSSVKPNKQRYPIIPLSIIVYIAWRNLVSKKLRTFLTVFGVIIGIGAIFFLLSFGLGLQNLVTKEIVGNQSIKSIDVSTTNTKVVKLSTDNVNKIRGLPHVEKTGLEFSFPGSLKQNGSEIDTIVYGVNTDYQDLSDLTTNAGRLISASDNKVIMLNESAVTSLGFKSNSEALNKTIDIKVPLDGASAKQKNVTNQLKVIGVVNTGSGSEVYIPSFMFETAGVPIYNQMKIIADDSKNVANLRQQIETLGYTTTSPSDTIDQVNQIFTFFNFLLVGFGAIGMIVAVLGMFNTLTISLLERTREIGLMMALGGRNRDMSKLFIFEAVLLSFIGALVGIFFAIISGQIVNIFMNNMAHRRGVTGNFSIFATPLWLIASLVGFMMLVGLVVALFPARRARHIDPIDALRRE